MRAAMFVLVAWTFLSALSAGALADEPAKSWDFVGRTQAAAAVEVRARATGYLTRLAVSDGAAVKKGDLLIEIDPRPYQLALDEAFARLKGAEAKLSAAKLASANTQKLLQNKVVSPQELAIQEAAQAEAEAELAVAKAEAERAQLNLAWTQVAAPLDGLVCHVQCTEGDLVAAERTRLLTVVSIDPMYVSFNVPEGIVLQLRRDGLSEPGKLSVAIGFVGEEGYPHAAKLEGIEPQVDPRTGTVRFRATVSNAEGLFLSGMSARVRLSPVPK